MSDHIRFLTVLMGAIILGISPAVAQTELPSQEQQITAAVSAAPADLQEGAMVLGYDTDTTLTTLREGTNNLICLTDDPRQSNFHVACYHKELEPFMKRGRELKAKGMSQQDRDSVRQSEIEAGKLVLPEKPMALYSLTGSAEAFDYEQGTVEKASPLYVVYIPYATASSTGLPPKPLTKGAPWIMEPGTPWAHIMVMTGRETGKQVENDDEDEKRN